MAPTRFHLNDRVDRLLIVELLPPDRINKHKYRDKRYKCLCDCGRAVIKTTDYLSRSLGIEHSCGCADKRKGEDRELAILKRLYHFKYLSAAIRKRIREISNLSFEDFVKLLKGPCYYCGAEYSMEVGDIIKGKPASDVVLRYNGIDRIDSEKGYVIDNCVSCCSKCNMAKRSMTQQEFYDWIKRAYMYNRLTGKI